MAKKSFDTYSITKESHSDDINNKIVNPESESISSSPPVIIESTVNVPEELLKKSNNNGQLEGMDPETGNYIRPTNSNKIPSIQIDNLKISTLKNNENVNKKQLQKGVKFYL